MAPPTTKCYGDRIKEKHGTSEPSQPQDQPKYVESYHSRTDIEERCERVRSAAPIGFHELLQKVIRAVILSRPVHVYRFIADMLDVELARRSFDDIMYGCMLKKSKKLEPYPTASCVLREDFLRQAQFEFFGEDQFMMGPIPDYELEKPALDRYRDYAGIGVFDMTVCAEPPSEPVEAIQTAASTEPPPCAEPTPEPIVKQKEERFDIGPIPEYQLQEPALDRYRDYAGIEPFDLIDGECEEHEPLCRCTFCSMKELGRLRPSVVEPTLPCPDKRRTTDDDPLKTFIDSPVYREEKVADEDAYKGADLSAIEPFGELFQTETPFEEDVFEPEYYPFGEKTFLQQHPMFGDFGVKGKAVDARGAQLVESPEFQNPESLFDPDPREAQLVESPECQDPESLQDPQPGAAVTPTPRAADETQPEAAEGTPVDEVFDDKKFDEQEPTEGAQTFEKQDFEPTEQPEETTEEAENAEVKEEA